MKFQCPEWQKGQKQKGNRKIHVDDDDDDDDDDNEMMIKKMSLYWEGSTSLVQSAGMSRLVFCK